MKHALICVRYLLSGELFGTGCCSLPLMQRKCAYRATAIMVCQNVACCTQFHFPQNLLLNLIMDLWELLIRLLAYNNYQSKQEQTQTVNTALLKQLRNLGNPSFSLTLPVCDHLIPFECDRTVLRGSASLATLYLILDLAR